jgi:hypothetical protein
VSFWKVWSNSSPIEIAERTIIVRKSLWNEMRNTSLEVVAAYADSYQRLGSQEDRCAHPCPPAAPRGDFLYDLVRMQLSHLNELARLGAAYSFIPARILERLYAAGAGAPRYDACPPRYDACPPPWDNRSPRSASYDPPGRGCDPRATGPEPCPPSPPYCAEQVREQLASGGDKVSFPITVRNACPSPQTVRLTKPVFKDRLSQKVEDSKLVVTLTVDGKRYDESDTFILNQSARVVVHVAVAEDIPLRFTYDARIAIIFSVSAPQSCGLILRTLD